MHVLIVEQCMMPFQDGIGELFDLNDVKEMMNGIEGEEIGPHAHLREEKRIELEISGKNHGMTDSKAI